MARVLHRVDVAQLAPGHRLIMQVRQYTLPLWPFWRLPMDGVCIQILPIPHNFHDLRPFGRKPCIAGGNFGGMGIHLYNFCSSAREAYPSTASPPKPNPTRRRSPRSLDCHATPVVPSYQPVLRIRRLVSRMVQPLGYDPASFPYEYGYFSIKICSTRSKK